MVTYLLDYVSIFQVFLILGIAYGLLLRWITLSLAAMDNTDDTAKFEETSVLKNRHFYVVYALFFMIMFIDLTFIGLAGILAKASF